jgi:hypothetical protein
MPITTGRAFVVDTLCIGGDDIATYLAYDFEYSIVAIHGILVVVRGIGILVFLYEAALT